MPRAAHAHAWSRQGWARAAHLVAGANLLQSLGAHAVHALANVGRLLLNVHQHLRWSWARGAMEA